MIKYTYILYTVKLFVADLWLFCDVFATILRWACKDFTFVHKYLLLYAFIQKKKPDSGGHGLVILKPPPPRGAARAASAEIRSAKLIYMFIIPDSSVRTPVQASQCFRDHSDPLFPLRCAYISEVCRYRRRDILCLRKLTTTHQYRRR